MRPLHEIETEGIQTILDAIKRHDTNAAGYKELGAIKATIKGDWILFAYTDAAVHNNVWNAAERVSRGLVINRVTGQLLTRPFSKFFEAGSQEETKHARLAMLGAHEITDKLDGSCGILFYDENNEPVFCTPGAFDSEQAVWATRHIRTRYAAITDQLPRDTTLIFELIYPENRIVVDYKERREICLIAARRIADGYDYSYAELQALAKQFSFPIVPLVKLNSFHDLLEFVTDSEGVEGWVARFGDGFRVKFKTKEYLRLHWLKFKLNATKVRETMMLGNFNELLDKLPDEHKLRVKTIADTITAHVNNELERIGSLFRKIYQTRDIVTRKDFAVEAIKYPKFDQTCLFLLYDGRDAASFILENLDIKALFPVEV